MTFSKIRRHKNKSVPAFVGLHAPTQLIGAMLVEVRVVPESGLNRENALNSGKDTNNQERRVKGRNDRNVK